MRPPIIIRRGHGHGTRDPRRTVRLAGIAAKRGDLAAVAILSAAAARARAELG